MSHLITAHVIDKRVKAGHRQRQIAHLQYAIGGGEPEVYRLFGATKFNGGVSGTGGGLRVSAVKFRAGLDRACQRHVDGEHVLEELVFFATVLAEWPFGARSVYVHFS
ncbi:hypothetical protein [Limnoglobus roseus]|uniref:Uncharacterized protein n=1 Tax=Limnoglobus roseus TaxID=2598579 RepID=A0A5C1AB89_9BACT|nr:hypothetical protein [Limnoglobus roseus]QEL16639.1 hypothetical protein PX52LOC_03599 [Limnoglobus roseus]